MVGSKINCNLYKNIQIFIANVNVIAEIEILDTLYVSKQRKYSCGRMKNIWVSEGILTT